MPESEDASRAQTRSKLSIEAAPETRRLDHQEAHHARPAQLLGRLLRWALQSRNTKSRLGSPTKACASSPPGSQAIQPAFTSIPRSRSCSSSAPRWAAGKRAVDYGMAEALAFASLVQQGIPIRMSGQDQPPRHLQPAAFRAASTSKTKQEYVPLQHIADGQAALRNL